MARSLGNIIADSLSLSLGYSERLLKDIPPGKFARYASPGGQMIESNHPAFIYGHLSLYGPRILKQLGMAAPAIPDGFESLFSKEAKCVDDPQGNKYPSMEQITKVYFEGYKAAEAALRAIDNAVLEQANPLEGRMAELFPTLGSLQAFYCGGHIMMHLGQMSAWRRMAGMGAA